MNNGLGGFMTGKDRSITADALPSEEIAALKELERRNRDQGAAEYRRGQFYGKGAFQLRAENLAYLRYISAKAGETVLDAGAGVGRLSMLVAPQVERLVCTDLSAHCLQVLKSEADAKGIRNIEAVEGDLCRLPRSLGPFDSAYSIEVLEHIPSHRERLAAVRKLYDLLRPGGRCLISDNCWSPRNRRAQAEKEGFWGMGERRLYHYYFTPSELSALLHQGGFRDIRLRGLLLLPGRITRLLPLSFASVESWCSALPPFAGSGLLVLGLGRRPLDS